MQAIKQRRMTAEEFIAWSIDLPDGKRYELMDGEVYEMASERYRHALAKARVYRRLFDAAEKAGLVCNVFTDGMAVRINEATVYGPDAALRVGAALDGDATLYDDPVIVVEVASPSTQSLDAGAKLADYFTLPSLRHYLIVRPLKPSLILHSRLADGTIQTSFAAAGPLVLDPPGITLQIESLVA